MARPTAEDRRRDYLEIGAEIATSFGVAESARATVDALAEVKVAEVADRAGVTKGAIYHVWPSQEAYRKDLLARLLEQSRQTGVRRMRELLATTEVDDDARRLLQRHARFVYDQQKDDPAFFARFSFFLYAADPDVRNLLARGDDSVVDDFAPHVELYLELVGRRLREPFTMELLLRSVSALFQGLCLRYRTSPDLVEQPPGEPTLYGRGLDALIEHFSEPAPDGDGGGEPTR